MEHKVGLSLCLVLHHYGYAKIKGAAKDDVSTRGTVEKVGAVR